MQPQLHDNGDPDGINQTDSQEHGSLAVDRVDAHEQEDLLGEIVVMHTSKEQLKVIILCF